MLFLSSLLLFVVYIHSLTNSFFLRLAFTVIFFSICCLYSSSCCFNYSCINNRFFSNSSFFFALANFIRSDCVSAIPDLVPDETSIEFNPKGIAEEISKSGIKKLAKDVTAVHNQNNLEQLKNEYVALYNEFNLGNDPPQSKLDSFDNTGGIGRITKEITALKINIDKKKELTINSKRNVLTASLKNNIDRNKYVKQTIDMSKMLKENLKRRDEGILFGQEDKLMKQILKKEEKAEQEKAEKQRQKLAEKSLKSVGLPNKKTDIKDSKNPSGNVQDKINMFNKK